VDQIDDIKGSFYEEVVHSHNWHSPVIIDYSKQTQQMPTEIKLEK
jgi:hypothetical protein